MVDREVGGDLVRDVLDPVVRDGAVSLGGATVFRLVINDVLLHATTDRGLDARRFDEAGHGAGDLRLPRPRLLREEHAVHWRGGIEPDARTGHGTVVQRAA